MKNYKRPKGSQLTTKVTEITNLASLSEDKLEKIEKSAALLAGDAFAKLLSSGLTIRTVETQFYKHPHVSTALELAKSLLAHYQSHDFIVKVEFTLESSPRTGRVIAYLPLDEAKELVDILLKRPIGTTTDISADTEMSAVMETLNVVGNAYLTAITNYGNETFRSSPPALIGSSGIDLVISDLTRSDAENIYVYFKNVLHVTKLAIHMSIFIAVPSE